MDEAISRVQLWVKKHANHAWQTETLTPNRQGFWSAERLQPGRYKVVARGRFSRFDAVWERIVELPPRGTFSLPLMRPKFIHAE
jgi:hypothetical protein